MKTSSIQALLFDLFIRVSFCLFFLFSCYVLRNEYHQPRPTQIKREEDYTIGIFQSIGLKEFHPYLVLPSSDDDEAKKNADEEADQLKRKLIQLGVDALKTRTRRYARNQIKWIAKRFLQQPDRQVSTRYLRVHLQSEMHLCLKIVYFCLFFSIHSLIVKWLEGAARLRFGRDGFGRMEQPNQGRCFSHCGFVRLGRR